MRRLMRLTAAELLKLSAHPFLYLSLGVCLAGVGLAEWLQPLISGVKTTEWRPLHASLLFAYGFRTGLQLATFVLLVFSSMMIAGELDRGTIKNLLTRPITRADLFLAKCATVVLLASLLFGFVLAAAALPALWRGQLGPVWDDAQYLVMRGGDEILRHVHKGVLASFLPFLAAGFLGILVSSLSDSSGFAVAAALMLYLFGEGVASMLGESAQQKVFTYYGSYALEKLRLFAEGSSTRWNPKIDAQRLDVWVPLAWIAAFLPVSFLRLRHRSVQG
jgi:ABC-type transport system involved in multi-copper enzyme maturation permease subunit